MPFRVEQWEPSTPPTAHPVIPTDLKVVAALFIISGIFAAIDILVCLLRSHINPNLGVLGIWIGFGLLNLRSGWRTCGLVFIWIALIGIPLVCLIFLTARRPLDVAVLGQFAGHTSPVVGAVIGILLFALALWEHRVLTRPDVRRLVGLPGA